MPEREADVEQARRAVPAIRDAQPGDLDKIVDVLVEAFVSTPDAVWLIPDERERRTVYRRYSRTLLEAALSNERDDWIIHVTDDVAAVAVWQNYVEFQPPPVESHNEILNATCGRYADRFRLLDSVMAANHPAAPHYHLAWLGVHPARQREGLGSALLRHAQQDWVASEHEDGFATYLVAVSPETRDFYLRRGFWIYRLAPVFLPDRGPRLWPMWRDPDPATGADSGQATT